MNFSVLIVSKDGSKEKMLQETTFHVLKNNKKSISHSNVKKKNEKKICKSVQYFQTYFLVFTFSHDLQWPLISFFFLSLGFSKSWSFQQWWWWWWWWWTIFVEWLNEKLSVAFFQLGLLSEILIITNLWYAVSRIWTWAEPEFRLWWMKLCSSDNNYTTAPQRVPWECQKSDLNFRSCCCKLFQ